MDRTVNHGYDVAFDLIIALRHICLKCELGYLFMNYVAYFQLGSFQILMNNPTDVSVIHFWFDKDYFAYIVMIL